jgi:hypothetical protein
MVGERIIRPARVAVAEPGDDVPASDSAGQESPEHPGDGDEGTGV